MRNSSSGVMLSVTRVETILAWPWVSVPVLSMTSARTRASVSIALPPLIRMPSLAARDSPATIATGTARMSGQGVATTSTATARIGSPVSHQAAAASATVTRQEHDGVAVGQPRHRGARALGGFHQADDAGIGAFRGRPGGLEIEGVADIGRAAQHRLAAALLHRQRLAGERRLVEHRHPFDHRAVDRHHVALADQQPVAGHNEIERDLLEPAVPVPHGAARHPRQQGGHLAPGGPLGIALQVLAAGIHQGDDGRGQALADQERPAHREGGDDVEPEVAAAQAGDDLRQQRQQDRDSDRGPDRRRPGAEPSELNGKAGGETEGDEAGEERPGIFERAGDRHGGNLAAAAVRGHDQDQARP